MVSVHLLLKTGLRVGSIVEQVKDGFTRSVITNDAQLDNLLRLQQEKRDFSISDA